MKEKDNIITNNEPTSDVTSNMFKEGDRVYLACNVYFKSDVGRVTLVAPDGTMITVSEQFIKPFE